MIADIRKTDTIDPQPASGRPKADDRAMMERWKE
jgi:hypothetical protein